eukprot:c22734_g1_i1 orf=272-1282(+)
MLLGAPMAAAARILSPLHHACLHECTTQFRYMALCNVSFLVSSVARFVSPAVQRSSGCSFCSASVLSKAEKDWLLAGVDKGNVEAVARVLEQAKRAIDKREVTHTDFLAPPAIDDALKASKQLSNVGVVVSGGYPQAERCRLSVGHVEAIPKGNEKQDGAGYPGAVAALSVSGNFLFEPATHGDFLGAVLGTGVAHEKIGDILVQDAAGAQILLVPELVEYLVQSLNQVSRVPVTCISIPLASLQAPPERMKLMKSVEASLRVDALASAGFCMSRSKLVDLISSGNVRINWKAIAKNDISLRTGDVISVRGKGRVEVGAITTTRKGKYMVELICYI